MTIIKNIKENKGRVTLTSLLIVSLLATAGLYVFVSEANAAALTSVKATLIDSRPGTASQINFSFTTVNPVAAAGTIKFAFTDAWTINTAIAAADISATGMTVVATCGVGGGDEVTVTNSNTAGSKHVTLTVCTDDTVTAGAKTVNIGTGSNKNTNPTKSAAEGTADIYTITIGAPQGTDSGDAMVAIIEGVAVSVTIDESLSFSIAGVTNTACTEGGTATQVTTTAITVPFGSSGLAANTFYKGCHDLTVSTNAASGYSVTNQVNTSLLRTGADSGDKTIDNAICDDGSCTAVIGTATTTPWATATANGFGYTCSGTACNAEFNTASEFNRFVCTGSDANCEPGSGGEAVAANTTPITSATAVSGQASRIVYKLSFGAMQPAGSYSNTVIYVATPTF